MRYDSLMFHMAHCFSHAMRIKSLKRSFSGCVFYESGIMKFEFLEKMTILYKKKKLTWQWCYARIRLYCQYQVSLLKS